jgi:hypothetical protein
VDDRGDDAVPFAALLGAYWLELESESGDQRRVEECECGMGPRPFPAGRAVMVAVAVVTVVAAVVAALV